MCCVKRCVAVLLRKDAADGIGLEMVDSLQTELETLLAAAAKRMRHLEVEIGVMAKWAEKGKERTPAVSRETAGDEVFPLTLHIPYLT